MAISEEGGYLAAGSLDNKVYLFDKNGSTPLWSYSSGSYVRSVAISADGEYIAASSLDGKVYLFDRDSGTPLWSYSTEDQTRSVAISADGKNLGASDFAGKVYYFTDIVNFAPTIELTSPSDDATLTTTSTLLTWDGEDANGDELTYEVYLDWSSEPASLLGSGLQVENLDAPGLNDGTYYWKVVASDGEKETVSDIWNFTVKLPEGFRPPTIELTLPANAGTVTTTSTTLTWEGNDADGDPLTYDVYLDNTTGPTTKVASGISTDTYTVTGLTRGTTYYWKVVVNDTKYDVNSAIWTFTVSETADDDEDGGFIPGPSLMLAVAGIGLATLLPKRRR